MRRTYRELAKIKTFQERYDYLKLKGMVGKETFGHDRYLNQQLYRSRRWKDIRDQVIIRDEGRDLGVEGYEIYDMIVVHHMNPITGEDIESNADCIYNIEELITTTLDTHNSIHYGAKCNRVEHKDRCRNDTIPWKK